MISLRTEKQGLNLARDCGYEEFRGPSGGRSLPPRTTAITGIKILNAYKGLFLVEITRTRTYAKSCKWFPSSSRTRFLVGRNENKNPFAHAVSKNCDTVKSAVDWIWQGKTILARQGE